MQKCIITTLENRIALSMIADKRIERISFFDRSEDCLSIGSIGICKVKKVVPGMDAAFVTFGNGMGGDYFLQFSKGKKNLIYQCNRSYDGTVKGEDEFLVQVVSEPIKMKAPQVSTELSLKGTYVIVSVGKGLKCSSKLSKKRKELVLGNSILMDYANNYQIMIRTSVEDLAEDLESLLHEAYILTEKLTQILNCYQARTVGTLFYRGLSEPMTILKEYSPEAYDEIITDNRSIYESLLLMCKDQELTPPKQGIRLYEDTYPLVKLYSLETALKHITEKKVWLKSGGFLMIEPTETLTVIDVNSGKNQKKEDLLFQINMEAAKEITYQLRARNISGMILIDFINMKDKKQEEQLIVYMKSLLKDDYVKCNYIDITGLGLMELTREKRYKTLREQMR